MTLTTTALTPSHDGWGTLSPYPSTPNLWTSLDNNLTVQRLALDNSAGRAGLHFTFTGLRLSAGGRVLDPPSFATATLQLHVAIGPTSAFPLYVYAVKDNQPATFSLTNFPGLHVATENVVRAAAGYATVAAGFTGTLSIPLHVSKLMATMHTVRTGATWQGTVALVLAGTETNRATLDFISVFSRLALSDLPTFTVTSVPYHTGFQVPPNTDPAARAIHSGRSGFPALSTDLIEDGNSEGVWVTADEWDPPDEYEEGDTYIPSPYEGNRVDEVPE